MDLITAVSYAIAEQDVRLTPKQALFRHYCRYGDSKTLHHLALTLGDDLFTSTAVDVYFHTVYTYGTLDMIRTLHELIPGRHHLEVPISNPNDDVVKLYGPRKPEVYIESLNITRLFRLFPDYKTPNELDGSGYLKVEIKVIQHLRHNKHLIPAITSEELDKLVKQGWRLIPYIVYDGVVRRKIKFHRLLKLAVVMQGYDYKSTLEKVLKLDYKRQLFYIIDKVGLRLMLGIYGKDAVISLIKKFPIVEVVDYIFRDLYLLSQEKFDVIDSFADKLVNRPYADLLALVTTKPELYIDKLIYYRGSVLIDWKLYDRIWDNFLFYVKRRPETLVEIYERRDYNDINRYAYQVLWLEGIKVDESKFEYFNLNLRLIKVNDEHIINMFLRNRNKEEIMEDLYYNWKHVNPYIIDYIMKTKGITREEIIKHYEEQKRKESE